MADRTASFRTDGNKLDRLDRLAKEMDRSRSWLINDALERYMEYEEWFRESVASGVASLQLGEAIAHKDVMDDARKLVAAAKKKRKR